jgi:transcriptional regulator with XRE-family HTH domain
VPPGYDCPGTLSTFAGGAVFGAFDASCRVGQRQGVQGVSNRSTVFFAALRLSLADLATRSGVSRSMISLIERGEASPTAVVLEKLASGLGVVLPALFEVEIDGAPEPGGPLARRADQPVWKDPASGYVRRNVSPGGVRQPMQIVEVRFPPAARVAFDNGPAHRRVYQQVWVLEGAINITVGPDRHQLRAGDCLAMQLDHPMFHNATRRTSPTAALWRRCWCIAGHADRGWEPR